MDDELVRAGPVETARALVSDRFPEARAAFLGAGILSARRTPTSDLDIVVVLAGPPAPYRESLRWHGWPVETFVHDADSLDHFFASDTARPPADAGTDVYRRGRAGRRSGHHRDRAGTR